MQTIQIKHINGHVLYEEKARSLKDYLEKLVEEEANLEGAKLDGANLGGANLGGANLWGANLGGADLRGAVYNDGIVINKQPLMLSGLRYFVLILDNHMKVGCEFNSFENWQNNGNEIAAKHNESEWWARHKDMLFTMINMRRQ